MERMGGLSLRTRMALLAIVALLALVVIGLLVLAAYGDVAASTKAVQNAAPADRDAAIEGLAGVARRMALALLVSGGVVVALGAGTYLVALRWVLRPLEALRGQLREVARDGHREHVIVPSGPPELWAVGADAEAMRRALLAEGDAARAADEGLRQESPVVSALRADLATENDPVAQRLDVHGEVHAAQGVLAGDWWGVVHLDGDRTALLLLDVAGHGELAGLITQRLRSVLVVALRSGFDAGTTLTRGALSFADAVDGRFATGLVIVLDPAAGVLTWANAGHPAGWVLPGGEVGARVPLAPTGPLMSCLGGTWTTSSAPLDVDDLVVIWSDGLVEGREAEHDVADAELARIVGTAVGTAVGAAAGAGAGASRAPRELVGAVLAALRVEAQDWRRDDVTLVVARRTH